MNTIRIMALLSLLAGLTLASEPQPWPAEIEEALEKSEGNRAELERLLRHYPAETAPLKRKAAEFLIANMPGHGYALLAYFDKDENEIPFDIAEYLTLRIPFDLAERGATVSLTLRIS